MCGCVLLPVELFTFEARKSTSLLKLAPLGYFWGLKTQMPLGMECSSAVVIEECLCFLNVYLWVTDGFIV